MSKEDKILFEKREDILGIYERCFLNKIEEPKENVFKAIIDDLQKLYDYEN